MENWIEKNGKRFELAPKSSNFNAQWSRAKATFALSVFLRSCGFIEVHCENKS